MNITRSPLSAVRQPIFYYQSLPIANVVKPRILLQRSSSPVLTFPRANSHYSSPVVYRQQNSENSLRQSQSSKDLYIISSPKNPQNIDYVPPQTYQRNLSPEAVSVLDILSRIKNTNSFQMNRLKKQNKLLQQSNIHEQPVISETQPIEPIENPLTNDSKVNNVIEMKPTTFKRSCNCSPRLSPKIRTNPEVSLPVKNEESQTSKRSRNCSPRLSPKNRTNKVVSLHIKNEESQIEGDIKLYRIDLKAAVNQSPNAVEVFLMDSKKPGDSPKRGYMSPKSPKKPGQSPPESSQLPKNNSNGFTSKPDSNDSNSELIQSKPNHGNNCAQNITNKTETLFFQEDMSSKNAHEENRKTKNKIDKKKDENIGKSEVAFSKCQVVRPHTEEKINISNENMLLINGCKNGSSLNVDLPRSSEDLLKKSSQDRSVSNLLGKINECLSKTSNILHKTYEEGKNEVSAPQNLISNNDNISSERNRKIKEELEENVNELKITTSPVKEMKFEIQDTTIIQNQLNEALKNFNAGLYSNTNNNNNNNNDERNFQMPHNKNLNNVEIEGTYQNKTGFYEIEQNQDKIIKRSIPNNEDEIMKSPEQKNPYASNVRDNFSPIVERSERDEDKENNSPFINIYTSKSGIALNSSQQENYEILRQSTNENRIPTSPSMNNTANVSDNPYKNEEMGKIMQSPYNTENEHEEKLQKRVIYDNYKPPSSFFKNSKKEPIKPNVKNIKKNILNKSSPKINNENKGVKSEKNLRSAVQIYESFENRPQKEKKPSEQDKKAEQNQRSYSNEKGSYAKMAQKTQKNKDPTVKKKEIFEEITTIDKEIENLERDAQRDKIDQKMSKFYDNYKSYKHKLPSIQENDDSAKRKSLAQSQTPSSSNFRTSNQKKPFGSKPEEQKPVKKEQKLNDTNNKIMEERCNFLYSKAIEATLKKQREIEENQKKLELEEKKHCTFKPEVFAKRIPETMSVKSDQKISSKTLKSNVNPSKSQQDLRPQPEFKRNLSQNFTKVKCVKETIKMNKSMSPMKNVKGEKKLPQKSVTHSVKPWISPRSTSSTKTRRFSRDYMLRVNNLVSSPHPNQVNKATEIINSTDPLLNGEIFDILKIFSGINEVLIGKKEKKQEEIPIKETNLVLEKLRDISPIKPRQNEEISQHNKSFNENSMNEMSSRNHQELRTSFEKVLGLLDQRHQQLLIKSMELTKKVDKVFKENAVYA